MRNNRDIIKATGKRERFSKGKLYRSLKRAGVDASLAEKVSTKVAKNIYHGINSKEVLKQATSYLKKENPILAAKYNLKKSIMELGPTGFPFEKYIAEILKEHGFKTEVGRIIKGKCIRHEVDIIARKNGKRFMVECKYHNHRGLYSDTKVVLYTFARFLDLKEGRNFQRALLVTNTRCTSGAVRYARCVGLKIISWRYPKNEGLEYLIEKKGLYPITILPSLNKYTRERLAQQKLILAKDLLKYSIKDLIRLTGLKMNIIKKLQEQAQELYIPKQYLNKKY